MLMVMLVMFFQQVFTIIAIENHARPGEYGWRCFVYYQILSGMFFPVCGNNVVLLLQDHPAQPKRISFLSSVATSFILILGQSLWHRRKISHHDLVDKVLLIVVHIA
jgi:hypothetical protein